MEHFFLVYGGALLTGFFVTLFLLAVILFTVKRLPVSKTESHHTKTSVVRFGGIALLLGFILSLWWTPELVFPTSWWVFSGVLIAALLVGLWDDFQCLSWKHQLLAQGLLLAVLYAGGVHILTLTHPGGGVWVLSNETFFSIGFLLFLTWGLLVINTLNWLDGVDGLCGSVVCITYATLFILALSPHVYQPAIAILAALLVGVTGAFLVYNFPKARIIAGTTGTLFFGLTIIFLSVVAGTKIATALLVLTLPIADAFFVLLKRFLENRSLFQPDRQHLHHLLQKRGWSDRAIVASYATLTLLISSIALSTETLGKFLAILIVFLIVGIVLSFFHFGSTISFKTLLAVLALLVGGVAWGVLQKEPHNAFVDGTWYQIEVADSPDERAQGLSDREEICQRCGMLFVFPEMTEPLFWMKDMRFSLDIVWLRDGRVMAKDENLPFPSTDAFGPGRPINAVLELPAGGAHDIPIGSKILFW